MSNNNNLIPGAAQLFDELDSKYVNLISENN